ncbi:DUF819 family protein [Marinilabiliaceae bacterium JC017]|nr:DUF819 family protein [Marinilabiliaceae bacterium JC017]
MTFQFFVVALYVLLPLLILYLCKRYAFLNRIGAVILSYAVGLILAQLGFADARFYALQEIVMSMAVPLAIPLLLFSSNVKAWRKLAAKPFYSLLFALISVVISVLSGYFIFKGDANGFNKVGGLLVGVYSGGTPNLASLKLMLDVDEEIYLAVHSYDMAVSTLYLFLLMGIGRQLFQLVLPGYISPLETSRDSMSIHTQRMNWRNKTHLAALLKVFVLALLIVLVAGGIMLLVPESMQMVIFIFVITGLGIVASSNTRVNTTKGSFEAGMYLVLIFSVVVASKVEIGELTEVNPLLFGYMSFVVFGSLLLHVIFARFKKIDADTVIITSVALICSPPFVPVLAGSLRNKEIIFPGITIGLIGYALGNYLGFLIAIVLQWI